MAAIASCHEIDLTCMYIDEPQEIDFHMADDGCCGCMGCVVSPQPDGRDM